MISDEPNTIITLLMELEIYRIHKAFQKKINYANYLLNICIWCSKSNQLFSMWECSHPTHQVPSSYVLWNFRYCIHKVCEPKTAPPPTQTPDPDRSRSAAQHCINRSLVQKVKDLTQMIGHRILKT